MPAPPLLSATADKGVAQAQVRLIAKGDLFVIAAVENKNMDYFNYKNGRLFAENVDVERIAVEVGTPVYIYSKATFKTICKRFKRPIALLYLRFAILSRPVAIYIFCRFWPRRAVDLTL